MAKSESPTTTDQFNTNSATLVSSIQSASITSSQMPKFDSNNLRAEVEKSANERNTPQLCTKDISIKHSKKSSPLKSFQVIRIKDHADRISIQDAPSCCTDLIGITLKNEVECTIDQITSNETIDLKRDFTILVACLDIQSSLEPIQETYYSVAKFTDEFECVSRLLTKKNENHNKLIFFIVSATRAKLIVPLIHSHRLIERIYICGDADNSQNSTWTHDYTKICDSWSTLDLIRKQLEEGAKNLMKRPDQWTRSQELFVDLWTQKQTSADASFVVNVDQRKFNISQIVTLFCEGNQRFVLTHDDKESSNFHNVQDCSNFITEQETSSIFLVIFTTFDKDLQGVKPLIDHSSVHAAYIFITDNGQHGFEMERFYISIKISGVFTCHKKLLIQLTTDICFYRQMSIHIPKMSLLKADSEVLAHLDECEKEFLRYQLFFDILPTLRPSTDSESELIKFIDVDDRLFINKLGQNINKLFKKLDFRTILKSNSQLLHFNQEIRSLPSEVLSSSITVYRAQLMSNDDLEILQKNSNALLSVYSFITASKSYPSVIKICRRAVDNGLTVVLFEIKLLKKTPVNRIPSDPDILIFPLGTVFRLKSIESTPDNVWHIQVDLINFNMQHFKDQLQFKTGKTLTSSTIDEYWTALDQFDRINEEAKSTILKCALA